MNCLLPSRSAKGATAVQVWSVEEEAGLSNFQDLIEKRRCCRHRHAGTGGPPATNPRQPTTVSAYFPHHLEVTTGSIRSSCRTMANRNGHEEELEDSDAEDAFISEAFSQLYTPDQATMLTAALEHAARQGERDMVQELVEAGAGIGNALHAAAEDGHEEIVHDLLENGAPVTAQDKAGNTPLHIAAQVGDMEIAQLLLLKGANINALNNLGRTPLYLAADSGHVGAALALMSAGADVNSQWSIFGSAVLQVATERGAVDVMRAAIERGADLDVVDRKQRTPLHAAANSNNSEAIDVLVEAGANIEARDVEFGSTPLHAAARNINLEALLALLKHGANISPRDMFQDTPLHSAARMAGLMAGAPDVVDSLLRSGADETILNDGGDSVADMLEKSVEEPSMAKEIELVRELLANAPAERAWKRRGYLVLCRAHADRMRQIQDVRSAHAGMVLTADGGAASGRVEEEEADGCTGPEETSTVDGRGGGDLAVVVAMVLGLEEEDVFRKIVGYL